MYLLDTDALSLTSPSSGLNSEAAASWRDWVVQNQGALYLSVITLMEVRFGVEKCLAKGATRKAAMLGQWLASAETAHRGRIIPVSPEIAQKAGALLWAAVGAGVAPSTEDGLVAATAAVKNFIVISRNAKPMQALKADWRDPLQTAGESPQP